MSFVNCDNCGAEYEIPHGFNDWYCSETCHLKFETADLRRQLAEAQAEKERNVTLYRWAREALEAIENWNGNDYAMREVAKDCLSACKEYEQTGTVTI